MGRDARKPVLRRAERRFVDQVDLVEYQQVGLAQLLHHGVADMAIVRSDANGFGIDQHHHGVDLDAGCQACTPRDRPRQCHATGFDQHQVGRRDALRQGHQGRHQIAADAAADASTRQAHHFAIGRFDQIGIDADGAEVIDHDRDAPTLRMAQQMIEQGGLAGAEIAAEHDGRKRHDRQLP